MRVGDRMKQRRKELRIDVDTIAEHMGVSPATVYRYEKGDIEKLPSNKLQQLADVLQTTPGWLMSWENYDEKTQQYKPADGSKREDSFDQIDNPRIRSLAVKLDKINMDALTELLESFVNQHYDKYLKEGREDDDNNDSRL